MHYDEASFSESIRRKKEREATKALLEDDEGELKELDLRISFESSIVESKNEKGSEPIKGTSVFSKVTSSKNGEEPAKARNVYKLSTNKRMRKREPSELQPSINQATNSVPVAAPDYANSFKRDYKPDMAAAKSVDLRRSPATHSKASSINTSQSSVLASSNLFYNQAKSGREHRLMLPEQINFFLPMSDSRASSKNASRDFRSNEYYKEAADAVKGTTDPIHSESFRRRKVLLPPKHNRSASNPSILEAQLSPPSQQVPIKLEFTEGRKGVVVTNLDEGDATQLREMDRKILDFLSPKEKNLVNIVSSRAKLPNKLVVEESFGIIDNRQSPCYSKKMRSSTSCRKNRAPEKTKFPTTSDDFLIKEKNLNIYLNNFVTVRSKNFIPSPQNWTPAQLKPYSPSINRPFRVVSMLKQNKLQNKL